MSSLPIARYSAFALIVGAGACSSASNGEPPTKRAPSPAASPVEGTAPAGAPVPLLAAGVTIPGAPAAPGCSLQRRIRADIGGGDGDCPSAACGSNSPLVNAFPYNGLHPDGCLNQDGAALVRNSLHRDVSACDRGGTSALYLDVVATPRGHELVARTAEHHSVVCSGAELVGATFDVATPGAVAVTLRISQIALIDVAQPRPPGEGRSTGPVPGRAAYLITPAARPGSSLCTASPPTTDRDPPIVHNRIAPGGKLARVAGEGLPGYAIVVPGAVYDRSAQLIAESVAAPAAPGPGSSHQWFNLACATDALGQTELSGLMSEPIVDRASAEARLPALHMFTAKYCGGVSATVRGTPLAWSARGIPQVASRADGVIGPIEAEWGPDGATCLSHSRLWISNKTVSVPGQLVAAGLTSWPKGAKTTEDDFVTRVCGGKLPKCPAKAPPDALASYTVDHAE
jgi:hypothetical protein